MLSVLILVKNAMQQGGVGEVLRQVCRRLPAEGIRPVIYNPDRSVLEFARQEMLAGHRGDLTSGWQAPLRHVRAMRHLRRVAATESIRLVHAHGFADVLRSGLALRRATGLPLVLTSHCEVNPAYRRGRWTRRKTRANARWMSQVDAMTHLNSAMREMAAELATLPPIERIIPNGCDVAWWSEPARTPLRPPRTPFFLSMGRLDPIKGNDLLLDAYARLARGGVGPGLVLAGDGREREALIERARTLGLSCSTELAGFLASEARGVCLPGHVSGETRRFVMQQCMALVHPNRTAEAFGIVFLEAMACAKPVVCHALANFVGLVMDDVNGLVVRMDDPRALADALRALATDPARCSRFGHAGLAIARRHDWSDIAGHYASLYRDLVPDPATSGRMAVG